MPDLPTDSPEPRLTHRKFTALMIAFVLSFALLTIFDPPITRACFFPDGRDDWWRAAIKFVGDLRFWLAVGVLAFALVRDWRWPAGILGSAALAGGVAELLKLVIGRERPVDNFIIQNDAHHVWRPLFQGFADGSNLGLPSSHAATAFGGATMLAVLVAGRAPSIGRAAFVLAGLCAASRVFTGAHFATDVLAGAFLGYLAAHTIVLVSDTMSKRAPNAPNP